MDWIVLILLVPLVLIPVVFLVGFSGCSFHAAASLPPDQPPPAVPSDLTATAVSSNEIDLTWKDNGTNTTSFRITRSENGAAPVDPTSPANPAPTPLQPLRFSDTGLNPTTPYEYQVFANVVGLGESAGSNIASATTFAAPLDTAYYLPLTADALGFEDATIIQRIDAGHLTHGATKVRITLRSAMAAALTINKVFISQAKATGQAWDSAADLVEVRFGGGSGIAIPTNDFRVSDVTTYNLVLGKDLIVAFNISGTAGSARKTSVAGPTVYFKEVRQEAGQQTRSANYLSQPDTVFIVEKIEVIP